MATSTWCKALPLALAAALFLGGCDDEEEKPPEIVVEVEKGTEVTVKIKEKAGEEMIIVGELALFATVIIWALFGPGATRRSEEMASENG